MERQTLDNHRDREFKIKRAMYGTRQQLDATTQMIIKTDDPQERADLQAKNEQRAEALRDLEYALKY